MAVCRDAFGQSEMARDADADAVAVRVEVEVETCMLEYLTLLSDS